MELGKGILGHGPTSNCHHHAMSNLFFEYEYYWEGNFTYLDKYVKYI